MSAARTLTRKILKIIDAPPRAAHRIPEAGVEMLVFARVRGNRRNTSQFIRLGFEEPTFPRRMDCFTSRRFLKNAVGNREKYETE
jgi:hypothetical protein